MEENKESRLDAVAIIQVRDDAGCDSEGNRGYSEVI